MVLILFYLRCFWWGSLYILSIKTECTVAQINEFAIVRGCWTEKRYLASVAHSLIKTKSCYWIIYKRWFDNKFSFFVANVLEMPDTSFLSNRFGLSRTHLFGRLYFWLFTYYTISENAKSVKSNFRKSWSICCQKSNKSR